MEIDCLGIVVGDMEDGEGCWENVVNGGLEKEAR